MIAILLALSIEWQLLLTPEPEPPSPEELAIAAEILYPRPTIWTVCMKGIK